VLRVYHEVIYLRYSL